MGDNDFLSKECFKNYITFLMTTFLNIMNEKRTLFAKNGSFYYTLTSVMTVHIISDDQA
jgi:hypothetical protein